MEHLRDQIGFHGYGQMDPLVEYKQEAYHSFQDLMAEIQRDIVRFLFTIKFEALQPPQEPPPSEAARGRPLHPLRVRPARLWPAGGGPPDGWC